MHVCLCMCISAYPFTFPTYRCSSTYLRIYFSTFELGRCRYLLTICPYAIVGPMRRSLSLSLSPPSLSPLCIYQPFYLSVSAAFYLIYLPAALPSFPSFPLFFVSLLLAFYNDSNIMESPVPNQAANRVQHSQKRDTSRAFDLQPLLAAMQPLKSPQLGFQRCEEESFPARISHQKP